MKAVCMVAGAAQREAQWVRQTAKAGAGWALRSPNTTFPPAGASGRPTQRGGGWGGAVGAAHPNTNKTMAHYIMMTTCCGLCE